MGFSVTVYGKAHMNFLANLKTGIKVMAIWPVNLELDQCIGWNKHFEALASLFTDTNNSANVLIS